MTYLLYRLLRRLPRRVLAGSLLLFLTAVERAGPRLWAVATEHGLVIWLTARPFGGR